MRDYYNNFYKEISRLDALGNSYGKIANLVPRLDKKIRILDVGCGHGTVSQRFVEDGHQVCGMEINKEAIESLKSKGFEAIEHDITIPFGEIGTFDMVLLLDVLEHVFEPISVLEQSINVLKSGGTAIISVPLYFDIVDRIRILFTGNIVSYDNLCYGKELYKKFRSFNYDHIRFFRPKDVLDMCALFDVEVEKIIYHPTLPLYNNSCVKFIMRLISNRYTVNLCPNLLAHSMILRIRKT